MQTTRFRLLLYAIPLAADFYLLPLLIQDTGSAMLPLLVVMPLLTLITGLVYGLRHGFSFLPALLAGVLFLPSLFLYYNASAWVYAPLYALITLLGVGLGRLFHQKR